MDGTRSTHGRYEKWLEGLKGRDHFEDIDVDVDVRIILEWILGK
jgi:hypothetical protein